MDRPDWLTEQIGGGSKSRQRVSQTFFRGFCGIDVERARMS
jgi:hypothetical protein